MTGKERWDFRFDVITHLFHAQWPARFHQDDAACSGETRSTSSAPPIKEVQRVVAKNVFAEHIRQPSHGLLDGPDALHDFRPALKQ